MDWHLIDSVPAGVVVLCFDEFYEVSWMCKWDGKRRCENGKPFPAVVGDLTDDVNFTHWHALPEAPNVR